MRYVIFGAGAVGGVIGGRLHAAGKDVVLVARGEHLVGRAIRHDDDGDRLADAGGGREQGARGRGGDAPDGLDEDDDVRHAVLPSNR